MKFENFFRPLLVTGALILIWDLTPLGRFPMAFIKLEGIRLPYTISFFLILYVGLVGLRARIEKSNWLACLIGAAVAGHLASIACLNLAELLLPDGMARLANSFHAVSASTFFAVEFVFPGVLAGWIVAPLAVFGLKIIPVLLGRNFQGAK